MANDLKRETPTSTHAEAPATPSNIGSGLLRSGLGTLISIGLLFLLFSGANFEEVWEQTRAFSVTSVLAAIGVTLACLPLRAAQWQWLLGNPASVRFGESLRSLSLGYLCNCLLPMRGGELVRTYLLARAASLSISRVLVSVVLSRAQDFPPILGLLVLALGMIEIGDSVTLGAAGFLDTAIEIPASQLTEALNFFALVMAVIAFVMIAGFIWLERVERLLLRLNTLLPTQLAERLEVQIAHGVDAMRIVGQPRLFWGGKTLAQKLFPDMT